MITNIDWDQCSPRFIEVYKFIEYDDVKYIFVTVGSVIKYMSWLNCLYYWPQAGVDTIIIDKRLFRCL